MEAALDAFVDLVAALRDAPDAAAAAALTAAYRRAHDPYMGADDADGADEDTWLLVAGMFYWLCRARHDERAASATATARARAAGEPASDCSSA